MVVLAGLASLLATPASAQLGRRTGARPLLVQATVCVLPGERCPRADEVVRVVVDGAERRVGFSDLTVLDGAATSGAVYAYLRPRPARLLGSKEELARLVPGTPLRMRAMLRPSARHLFVESLEPAGGDESSDGDEPSGDGRRRDRR